MEKNLIEEFKNEICIHCSNKNSNQCKHNIMLKSENRLKTVGCLDYNLIPIKVSKKTIRENRLDENLRMKFNLYLK